MAFPRIRDILNLDYYYNSYHDRLSDFNRALTKIDEFFHVNYITLYGDFAQYFARKQTRARVFIVLITRIALLLNMLRFYLSIILRKCPSKIYLMDYFEYIGQPILIASSIGTLSLAILAIGTTLSYQELIHTAHFIDMFDLIRKGRVKYPLKPLNHRKYCIKVNLVADFIFKECHIFMVLFCFSISFVLTLLLLIRHEFSFIFILLFLFYNFISIIFFIQCFGYVWAGFTMWFMSTLYLKYKFREIRDKIELSLKHSNINLLMNAIEEHNYVEIMTKKFNHFFRMITFIIYYIATIGFQILFFVIHNKDSTPFGRVAAAVIFITCFWAVVFMNIMSTWVISAAHKPYYKLYSVLQNRGFRMRFRHHWKILSFIEKLSGRPIGYYCYDLFPMNNWEFYQYLCIAGSNYILIMGLFN